MKKTFALLVLCVMVATLAISCASMKSSHMVTLSGINSNSVKVGQAESRIWLTYFGERSFPTVKEAADKAGITKVASVEYYARLGILGLWTDYYTIVTGE